MHRRRNEPSEDEEIDSDDIPDAVDSTSESSGDENQDNYFVETAQEKLVRMTQERLKRKREELGNDEDLEKELILEDQEDTGIRFDIVNVKLSETDPEPIRFRAHRGRGTAIVLGPNSVFSASKDKEVVQMKIVRDIKLRQNLRKFVLTSPVLCLDYHNQRKLLACGCQDGSIVIYNLNEQTSDEEAIGPMIMGKKHRPVADGSTPINRDLMNVAITGIRFNQRGAELYSTGEDRTVRVWDIDNGNCMQTFYGHQEAVYGLDFMKALVTCGADRTVRDWKLDEAKHFVSQSKAVRGSIDCISLFNAKMYVTGAQDGKLCLWTLSSRKPMWIVKDAHGPGNWISAVAAWRFKNICASGSSDGFVRFWEVKDKRLHPLFTVPLPGYVNGLQFGEADGRRFLAAQVSNEQRLGRWLPNIPSESAKQGVYIIYLDLDI